MSQSEYHTGKIVKAFQEPKSFEEGISILAEKYGIDNSDIEIEDKYVYSDIVHYINNEFYIIENHSEFDPDCMSDYTINPDGSIFFTIGFYNGGTCLSEVLGDIIEKVNNTETAVSDVDSIRIGDVVKLKGGSPIMTVINKQSPFEHECAYTLESGRLEIIIVHPNSLIKTEVK